MPVRMILVAGVLATLLSTEGPASAQAARNPVEIVSPRHDVGRYEKLEFQIQIDRAYANPLDPGAVAVDLLIDRPDGRSLVLPAFFGQDYERRDMQRGGKTVAWCYPIGTGTWKARLAPDAIGTYTVRARVKDPTREVRSPAVRFDCTASARRGFLRTGTADPRFLEFTDGTPFFAIGQNLAFIGEGQYVTVPKAEAIFGTLAANGANFLRIWTCCNDWALAVEARKSAWARSWSGRARMAVPPAEAGGPHARQCVRLSGQDGDSVSMSPSHAVALRPETRYVFSGRALSEGATSLRYQIGSDAGSVPAAAQWQRFQHAFTTGPDTHWLAPVSFALAGSGTVWLDAISLKEADGGPELLWEAEANRPVRGYYNPLDCFLLDQLVDAADRNGIYLMLCILTRDLYMDTLSQVGSVEYKQATKDAARLMRYAAARWGYSTSVAAWEYFNEMDPGKPTDPFYLDVGRHLDEMDIYRHLRTTSTWHPSARDCKLAQLGIAQAHRYMRPDDVDFKDEVTAVIEQTRFLREHAPAKPALIGEFGLATAKWGLSDYMKQDTEGVHFHNTLWASAFAGNSGTAMFWWWELLDQQNAYRHYKPLSAYLANVSFVGLGPLKATPADDRLQVLGYQGADRAYMWLINREATWWNRVVEKREPAAIEAATVPIEGLTPGEYTITWWDTWSGRTVKIETASETRGLLHIAVPPLRRDLACRVEHR